jgi:uncharacterized membrane protein YjfL (UPF0719 family)
MYNYINQTTEIKEDFCAACLTIPLAFTGASLSAYGASSNGSHKKLKKILLWSGVGTVLLSLLIIIYVYYIKKDCTNCR